MFEHCMHVCCVMYETCLCYRIALHVVITHRYYIVLLYCIRIKCAHVYVTNVIYETIRFMEMHKLELSANCLRRPLM